MTRPHQLHEMSWVVKLLPHVVYKDKEVQYTLNHAKYTHRIWAPGGLATPEAEERLPAGRVESESDYQKVVILWQV